MKEIPRILLLEDLESDAQLAENEIKKTLASYQLKWVENRVDFINALNSFNPDIIISDYNLPSFDGLSALKIKLVLKPDVPFILLTGSMNEDTAVDCMKAGASDYIIKEHIKRLGQALTNALEQKEIIAAKRNAEQAVIKSEARFHRLADNMPDMIYRVSLEPNRSYEYVNPEAEKITGYSIDEFYADPELGNRMIHPEDLHILAERLESSDFYFKPIITRLLKKDGTIIWFEQRNIPVYDETGKIIAFEGIAQDITEKRNAEILKQAIFAIAQAVNSSRNLNELYANVHKIIAEIMPATNFYIALYHSKSNKISFPYFVDEKEECPPDRKLGRGFTEYVIRTSTSLLCTRECALKLISSGEVERIGVSHAVWLGVPLKSESNTIGVMVVQHYHDENAYGEKEKSMLEYISTQVAIAIEQKQADEQILKLSKVVEQSPVSIVITNTNSEIEYINQAYTELTGYKTEELIGKNPRIFKSGKMPQEIYSKLWKTILSGNVWKGELINKKKNGELFIQSASISPITDENGKIINFLAVSEDITNKKLNEQELIAAKEKAEENDKLKTAFLQNMSHEIRTPMNAIVGFSELMELEIDKPEKLKYYTKVIRQRSDDLLGIINDLLDISRIEAGQLILKPVQADLNKLFEELRSLFSVHNLQIEKSSINLKVKEIPSNFNSIVSTDVGKLKQIFSNLIHNAFKFTSEGKIEFGFHSINNNKITFFVTDSGSGISESMKDLIFERFRKSADESVYVQDGMGLGLAIVKGLLKLFDGKVRVESELNKGSTFYFTIPYFPVTIKNEAEIPVSNQTLDWSKFTLLIVEDDKFNIAYFVEILKSTGIKLLIGETGNQAISLFTNNQNIDLVLMDIKLPDMNGYEVTKEIKKINPNIPVIAQTAYASESDKEQALETGCDDLITKPIKAKILISTISKYI